MQKFVEFYNRVYYSVYCICCFWDRNVFGKITECLICRPLYRLDFTKRRLKKYGWDTYEKWIGAINNTTGNLSSPICQYFCSGAMAAIFIFTFLTFIQFLVGICGSEGKWFFHNHFGKILIVLAGLDYLLAWKLSWKNGRDQKYFAKFQKESRKKRVVWNVGVLLYSIFILVAWIWTLTLT